MSAAEVGKVQAQRELAGRYMDGNCIEKDEKGWVSSAISSAPPSRPRSFFSCRDNNSCRLLTTLYARLHLFARFCSHIIDNWLSVAMKMKKDFDGDVRSSNNIQIRQRVKA